MTQSFKIGCVGLILLTGFTGFTQAQTAMSVATYNIRYDNPRDTIKWHERHQEVADAVRYFDIVGLQEVLPNQWQDLQGHFKFHDSFGRGREADGGGEACPIFYDRERFDFLHGEVRWLAETGWDQPGTIGWDADLPRIATIVLLRERESGKKIRVINAHLSHVGENARAGAMALMAGWAGVAAPDEVTLLIGDWNMTADAPAVTESLSPTGLEDAYFAAEYRCRQSYVTYTTFLPEHAAGGERIDHIFVRGAEVDWVCAEEIIKYGVFVSDHMPVHAELTLR